MRYLFECVVERIEDDKVYVRMVRVDPPSSTPTTSWWPYGMEELYTEFERSLLDERDNADLSRGTYLRWEISQTLKLVRNDSAAGIPGG